MGAMGRSSRLVRIVGLLAIGSLFGGALVASPAAADFRESIDHIWDHIVGRADDRYANAVSGTDKAKNADKVDGLDARALRTKSFEDRSSYVQIPGVATEIVSLDLPRGKYVLMGKVHLAKDDAGSVYVFCDLVTSDSENSDSSGAMIGGEHAARVSVPLLLTHTFASPGTATITCDPSNPTDTTITTSASNSLVAIKVGAATRQ